MESTKAATRREFFYIAICTASGTHSSSIFYMAGADALNVLARALKLICRRTCTYVLAAVNEMTGESFAGYGITNEIDVRIVTHKGRLRRHGYILTDLETFYFKTGAEAKLVEKIISKSFQLVPQDIDGFREEAPHAYEFDSIINLVEKELEGCQK